MVDGRVANTLAVVDLDGTLIEGNSLRMFMRFLLRRLLKEHRWLTAMRLGALMGLRAMRLVSHKAMKHPFHREAERLAPEALEEFVGMLVAEVNTGLLQQLRDSSCSLLLATAAPEAYSRPLAQRLGFTGCVATSFAPHPGDYRECRAEQKVAMAQQFADENGFEIKLAVTDHSDDLPLLRLNGIDRILVNPAPRLTDSLTAENLPFRTHHL